MSNGAHSLAKVTELGQQELEDAHKLTFDDFWIETAEQAHGIQETLDYTRRLQNAVQAARAKELEQIVSAMEENEQELRAAVGDVEEAKQDVANIAGYINAVTKVVGLFEKALRLAAGGV